jgi:SPP1 family predicted phage head-tail adaptor
MRAGSLNRRVALQQVVMTSDTEGVSSEAWSLVSNVWANINPAGGTEQMQAGQTEEKITHRVTIRWRSDLNTRQRFVYGTRVFLIHSMLDQEEAHREVDCLCEEIITTGLSSA